MKKFDAVLWNLEETRKVYTDRIKFNENPKVKGYLLKRSEEFTEAISILNGATVSERNLLLAFRSYYNSYHKGDAITEQHISDFLWGKQ